MRSISAFAFVAEGEMLISKEDLERVEVLGRRRFVLMTLNLIGVPIILVAQTICNVNHIMPKGYEWGWIVFMSVWCLFWLSMICITNYKIRSIFTKVRKK